MNAHEKAHFEARERTKRCLEWILGLMKSGQPKPASKDELFRMASAELDITRRNFDDAWFMAIHQNGRDDWYRPVRRENSKPN